MGIIPTLDTYGNDCALCYGPGRTPLTRKLFFSGIKTGDLWGPVLPLPPNGYHDIVQLVGNNCAWWGAKEPRISYGINYIEGQSSCVCRVALIHQVFLGTQHFNCARAFTNLIDDPEFAFYWGGYAYVGTAQSLTDIIESVTPMIDPDPRMECFPMTDDKIAVRYAGKRDATNVMIKFDTSP